MTRYMLATNTLSHLLRKHPAVARRVVAVPITALCISAITHGELLFGLAKRPDATALHEEVREFLRRVDVLPRSAAASEVCGTTRAAARREGRDVVATLVGASNKAAEPTSQPLGVNGKQVGRWSRDGAGRLTVQFEAAHLNDDRHLAVLKSIAAALKG